MNANPGARDVGTDTESISHVGDRRTPTPLRPSSCGPVPDVGSRIRDVSASRPRSITSFRDRMAAMIPTRTRGPRVRHVTESEETVNHFNPNDRRAPRAFDSPTDGDRVADILRLMIGDYYVEASRWPRSMSDQIRIAGDVLWDIRDRLITGELSPDDGSIWADQGYAYLDACMRKRARNHHPSGRGGPRDE